MTLYHNMKRGVVALQWTSVAYYNSVIVRGPISVILISKAILTKRLFGRTLIVHFRIKDQ